MEVIGFLFLCALNGMYSMAAYSNLAFGGGDLGPLLTGWVHWSAKVFGLGIIAINAWLWYILYSSSPFTITVS